jgi:hypothetical protein
VDWQEDLVDWQEDWAYRQVGSVCLLEEQALRLMVVAQQESWVVEKVGANAFVVVAMGQTMPVQAAYLMLGQVQLDQQALLPPS